MGRDFVKENAAGSGRKPNLDVAAKIDTGHHAPITHERSRDTSPHNGGSGRTSPGFSAAFAPALHRRGSDRGSLWENAKGCDTPGPGAYHVRDESRRGLGLVSGDRRRQAREEAAPPPAEDDVDECEVSFEDGEEEPEAAPAPANDYDDGGSIGSDESSVYADYGDPGGGGVDAAMWAPVVDSRPECDDEPLSPLTASLKTRYSYEPGDGGAPTPDAKTASRPLAPRDAADPPSGPPSPVATVVDAPPTVDAAAPGPPRAPHSTGAATGAQWGAMMVCCVPALVVGASVAAGASLLEQLSLKEPRDTADRPPPAPTLLKPQRKPPL